VQTVKLYLPSAVRAAFVVAIFTVAAEREVRIAAVVIGPDAFAAMVADAGFSFAATLAQLLTVEHKAVDDRVLLPTVGANKGFVHVGFLRFFDYFYDALL